MPTRMLHLNFTLEEMIKSLEKIGYEIKEETVVETASYYNDQTQEIPHRTFTVSYGGHPFCNNQRLYGTKRVEYVFEKELHKKLLGLF